MKRDIAYRIRCDLDNGFIACVVAERLDVTVRLVRRIQTKGRCAINFQDSLPPSPRVGLLPGVITAANPSPATAAYWQALGRTIGQPIQSVIRKARSIEFDDLLEATVAGIQQAGREGRGAA